MFVRIHKNSMPVFANAADTMSLYSYLHAIVNHVVVTYYTVVALKDQYKIRLQLNAEIDAEKGRIRHTQTQCSALTQQEVNEFATHNKFSNLWRCAIQHDDTIVLKDGNKSLITFECMVNEYLSVTQLLNATQHKSCMSHILRNALYAIVNLQNDELHNDKTTGINKICILVENIIFNRIPLISQTVEYTLKPYIRINEMLQLLCILHDATYSTLMTQTDSDTFNIVNIVEAYEDDRRYLMNMHGNMNVCQVYINEFLALVNAQNLKIHYNVLLATQVFAALTMRVDLLYEIQLNFNSSHKTHINVLMKYAQCKYGVTNDYIQLEMLKATLIQLRVAHILRSHYMYGILGVFAGCTLTLIKTKSHANMLALQDKAHICKLLLMSLDTAVEQISSEFAKHIYASVLILIANKHYEHLSLKQMREFLHTLNSQQKKSIIDNAIYHLVNVLVPQRLVRCINAACINEQVLEHIILKLSPLQLHTNYDNRLVKYLQAQAMQILNNLHNERTHSISSGVIQHLLNECYDILHFKVPVTMVAIKHKQTQLLCSTRTNKHGNNSILVRGDSNSFTIPNLQHNVVYVVKLVNIYANRIHEQINKEPDDAVSYIASNAFRQKTASRDKYILYISSFIYPMCKTHALCMFINSTIHEIYGHCIKRFKFLCFSTAMISGVLFVTQQIVLPLCLLSLHKLS